MAEMYDFETYKVRKQKEDCPRDKRLVVAVYQSTVYYVNKYSDVNYENPFEHLTTHTKLKEIYRRDQGKFLEMLTALLIHWDLEPKPPTVLPDRQVFEQFPTLGELCMYIEKRVKD